MNTRSPLLPPSTDTVLPVQTSLLQRKCADCKSEDKLLQRRATNQTETIGVPPIVHEVLNSPGQPLDSATRAFMEPRFGHDFSRVRIHTDTQAVASAQAVQARAYTVGQAIVFGAGQYVPETPIGQKLLAHELTHTIQQKSRSQSDLQIGSIHDPAESAADRMSDWVTDPIASSTPAPSSSPGTVSAPVLQRDPLPASSDFKLRPPPEIARAMGRLTLGSFALNRAELSAEHQAQLTSLALTLIDLTSAYPGGLINVTGHTDASGSEERNQILGQQRADAVKAALVAAGVSVSAIVTDSSGANELLIPTQAPEPQNRRVQIQFEPEPLRFFKRSFNLGLDLSLTLPTPVPPASPSERLPLPRIEWRPETLNERVDRMLRQKLPPLPSQPGISFNNVFLGAVDDTLNHVMDGLGIKSEFVRKQIRAGAHAAIDKGVETLIDQATSGLESNERKAIQQTVKALRDYRVGKTGQPNNP